MDSKPLAGSIGKGRREENENIHTCSLLLSPDSLCQRGIRRTICLKVWYALGVVLFGFFCFGKIILELKAVNAIADEHRRQILNYLRITHCKLGLLINFGAYPKVAIERYAL